MDASNLKRAIIRRLPRSAAANLRAARPAISEQLRHARRTAGGMRRWLGAARRARAFRAALDRPVDTHLVLWESFGGNGALCNPEALFRAALGAADLSDLTHVWALRPEAAAESAIASEFADHPRVRIVDYRSPEYFAALESAGWLINNATFPREFIKRPEQTYLNTWHGTPIKTMGYDEPDGPQASINVLRNLLSADYLLSSGPTMTEQMYRGAYRLAPIFTGRIIEDGSPRIDAQLTGRRPEGQAGRTLLYAPTWRGASFRAPQVETRQLRAVVEALRAHPDLQGWQIRLKVHQSVYAQARRDTALADVLVPNAEPANAALAACDLLLTDFSSIWVDALASEIPLVFYAPDFESYLQQRGTYLPAERFPGPIARTRAELDAAIAAVISGAAAAEFAERYAACRAAYVPGDDGKASQRILDIVFRGQVPAQSTLRTLDAGTTEPGRSQGADTSGTGRTRIVMHPGGLKPNGISRSALNLLTSLDPDRYDLTVVFTELTDAERLPVRERIPAHVRIISLPPGLLESELAGSYTQMLDGRMPEEGTPERAADDALWSLEWRRFVGQAAFDAAIDFSGYSGRWARLISVADAGRRLIWMHNDLQADAGREIDGQRPYARTLRSVFALYDRFDALVSVSPALAALNRENLAGHLRAPAAAERFRAARNTIDAAEIRAAARGPAGTSGTTASASGSGTTASASAAAPVDLDSALDELCAQFGTEAITAALERRRLLTEHLPDRHAQAGGTVFATMGRMSPEKNQLRLLEAFAAVVAEVPDCRLVIIGSGPLEAELHAAADELGISAQVTFAGHQRNPHPLLEAADCFVLSSDYEGQPMVILEALALGLPVITTNFGSAASAFPDDRIGQWGTIVDRGSEPLAAAMLSFARDHSSLPRPDFDADAYNAAALDEFEAALAGAHTPAHPHHQIEETP